ncbi:MAG TPA: sugar phosphate nucleotidyltransferase [Vicinamibacterales bacterium]|nr:sugar phosphate nucleotidyltransferase [Vicinamibacterales bacterium]
MYNPTFTQPNHWAAILAGGDGTRLQRFTEALFGDNRPKQFCRLLGQHTLLASTRMRLAGTAAPQRTLAIVTRHHEPFYRDELAAMPATLLIEQPGNRGTAVAIIYALSRIARSDPRAVIGLFPSDHHYENESAFQRATAAAYALASCEPSRLVILGAKADRPETEYGWIARGPSLGMTHVTRGHSVHGVQRFHEKPDLAAATELLRADALWNTFVMVGHISAFVDLLARSAPVMRSAFEWLRRAPDHEAERREAEALYTTLPSIDFSKDVLSPNPGRLSVLTMVGAGWTDLGHASRIQAILGSRGDRQVGLAAS